MNRIGQFKWRLAQFSELRWWQWYLKGRNKKEYLAKKRLFWKKVLELMDLELVLGEQVLEAGCGPAGIFLILKDQKVDALDPLWENYKKKVNLIAPHDYPQVRFINAKVEDWRINNRYSKVFCLNVINHVSDLEKAIANLADSIQSGGQLLLSVDAHNSPFLKKIFQVLPGDILHPQQYALEDYLTFWRNAGLKDIKIVPYKKNWIFTYYFISFRKL